MKDSEAIPIMGELIITATKAAKEKAKNIENVSHPLLKGRFREAFIEEILLPYLPSSFRISTGKIFDSTGNQSDECDILIIDPTRIPPILQTSSKLGLFPVESVLAVIEVKSKLTATEYLKLNDKGDKETGIGPNAKKVDSLACQKGMFIRGQNVDYVWYSPLFAVFAYESDAKQKDEIDRAKEKIPEYFSKVHEICVVGKSTHLWTGEENYVKIESNGNMLEVRAFISGLVDMLSRIAISRGYPPMCKYLLNNDEVKANRIFSGSWCYEPKIFNK